MRREDYRATLTMMLGLMAATLTGFMRKAALARQLGAGRATDIIRDYSLWKDLKILLKTFRGVIRGHGSC